MTRTVLTVALLACLAVGCGAQQSGGGVASVTTTTMSATPTATPTTSVDPQERGRKFAQCMRDHGVPMEDPAPDGSGGLSVIAKKGDGKTKDALEACRELAPIKDRDELTPADLDKLREFAKCMRDHGVDMPDPAPDGTFGGTAGSIKRDDPTFTKALEACRATFPKIGGGK
ncbi:hypothetical protein ACU635_52830 [[Actinomadura] parvosata]|uniref:hypothetical protein n=1 Tax=[Actinomadura] parvosata TaxID=1955412 RepID=UPI00406C6377